MNTRKHNTKKKDKKQLIYETALRLFAENGSSDTPIAQVAKLAGISVGTIYLYFSSKQDLINKLYLKVRKDFSDFIFKNFNKKLPTKEAFRQIWLNMASYWIENPRESFFLAQCDATQIVEKDLEKEGLETLRPLLDIWTNGQEQGIIKRVSLHMIYAFSIPPIHHILRASKAKKCSFEEEDLELVFQLVWDSIKE